MEKVNLNQKFSLIQDYWSPKIAGEINDSHVKLVKFKGEFVIIPKGIDHLPIADEEAHVILLEPKTTLNTGNTQNERTVTNLEQI